MLKARIAFRRGLVAMLAAAAIVAIDQASKHFVVETLDLRQRGEIVAAPFLAFRMAWNTGVNFGLLSGDSVLGRYLLIGFTSLLAASFLIAAFLQKRVMACLGLGIVAGGAIGNLIDRFTYGAVADFLNVSCCGIANPWSFNVADIAIFAGFGLLILPARKQVSQTA